MVAEADESDGSFLKLNPMVAVVTTIDREHLDFYQNLDEIQRAFGQFLNKVPFYGFCVVCADEPNIRAILPDLTKKVFTYGLQGDVDYSAREVRTQGLSSVFVARRHGNELGSVTLNIPGLHNIRNALAAIATGVELDIPFAAIREALHDFSGIHRRFRGEGGSARHYRG